MSDHIDAARRTKADKVSTTSEVITSDYVIYDLPFHKSDELVRTFSEIRIGLRPIKELQEIVDIMNLIFATDALNLFISFYENITQESPEYLYDRARMNAMGDLRDILSLKTTDLMQDANLNRFFTELEIIFSENFMEEA